MTQPLELLRAADEPAGATHVDLAFLGDSLAADTAASGINYDWWQEFTAQATGLGTTFTPSIIGFATVLDNISGVLDARAQVAPLAAALTLYLAGWAFLSGGILDRYARQRPIRTHGFFAASGEYGFRFVRLAAAAGLVYWWLFAYVHPWLFDTQFENITRGLGLHASSRVLVALVEKGGVGRDEAYAIVQRAALRAADERAPLRDLLAVDPVVAQKLPLAALDACFDEATFLRNVHEVIARLDTLSRPPGSSALPTPPTTEPSRADG